mmetsp:Transcript_27056/g.64383  ORF Transcript_27056/g.64383 Transcript_27056/m.64383 type:complete len:209 (+) Transcript_27056:1661-2287(+)
MCVAGRRANHFLSAVHQELGVIVCWWNMQHPPIFLAVATTAGCCARTCLEPGSVAADPRRRDLESLEGHRHQRLAVRAVHHQLESVRHLRVRLVPDGRLQRIADQHREVAPFGGMVRVWIGVELQKRCRSACLCAHDIGIVRNATSDHVFVGLVARRHVRLVRQGMLVADLELAFLVRPSEELVTVEGGVGFLQLRLPLWQSQKDATN